MNTMAEPPGASALPPEGVVFSSFRSQWRDAFADLNRAWIARFFHIEPSDEALLSDPEGRILSKGGEIFFAILSDRVVGTCALMVVGPSVWEIVKLAVDPDYQGLGIGHTLVSLCYDAALNRGAKRIIARTNPKLGASYHLFRSLGFQDMGPDLSGDYARESLLLQYLLSDDESEVP